MIYDHLDNIERYRTLMPSLYEGLTFLREATASLAVGRHTLSGNNYANVQDYQTLYINPVGYEAHRRYIDIQYCLTGQEIVAVRQLPSLIANYQERGIFASETMPQYITERDVTFYKDDERWRTELKIGNGYFLILNSNDAHMPQLCIDKPISLRKIIVKIEA